MALGEETCSSEFKLLLMPSELQLAVNSFHAGKSVTGRIYLFDTDSLDLLSRGVILRVRRTGTKADLMVKVRIPTDETVVGIGDASQGYKCEIDQSGDSSVRSYSVLTTLTGDVPNTGNDLSRLLSAGQRKLLDHAKVRLDWNAVKRIAEISSTVWQIRKNPDVAKLTLELWQWPTGQLLEISTKAAPGTASDAVPLRNLVAEKGLSPDVNQMQKTELVLRNIRKDSSP